MTGDIDTVEVHVPRRLLGLVYALLGQHMSAEEAVDVRDNGRWAASHVRELYQISDARPRKLLGYLAEQNGNWLTYGELAQQMEVTDDRLRFDLAKLTHRCKRVRGGKSEYPLEQRYNGPDLALGARVSYRMDPVIAQWWLTTQAEADGVEAIDPETEEASDA